MTPAAASSTHCPLQAGSYEGSDGEDDDRFNAPATMFDSSKHYLHGTLHLNGCGHLERVNGREGGSVKLNGRQIMNVWDKLCQLLRVREVREGDILPSCQAMQLCRASLPVRCAHDTVHVAGNNGASRPHHLQLVSR